MNGIGCRGPQQTVTLDITNHVIMFYYLPFIFLLAVMYSAIHSERGSRVAGPAGTGRTHPAAGPGRRSVFAARPPRHAASPGPGRGRGAGAGNRGGAVPGVGRARPPGGCRGRLGTPGPVAPSPGAGTTLTSHHHHC